MVFYFTLYFVIARENIMLFGAAETIRPWNCNGTMRRKQFSFAIASDVFPHLFLH